MKPHILSHYTNILITDWYGHVCWLKVTKIVMGCDLNSIQGQGENQPPK